MIHLFLYPFAFPERFSVGVLEVTLGRFSDSDQGFLLGLGDLEYGTGIEHKRFFS